MRFPALDGSRGTRPRNPAGLTRHPKRKPKRPRMAEGAGWSADHPSEKLDARGAEEFTAAQSGIDLRRFKDKVGRGSGLSHGQIAAEEARHLGRAAVHAPAWTGAGRPVRVAVLARARLVRWRRSLFRLVRGGIVALHRLPSLLRPAVLAARVSGTGRRFLSRRAVRVATAGNVRMRPVGVGHQDAAGGQMDHQRHDGNQTYPPARHGQHQNQATRILRTHRHVATKPPSVILRLSVTVSNRA